MADNSFKTEELFSMVMTEEKQKALDEARAKARANYGVNKPITEGNYDNP